MQLIAAAVVPDFLVGEDRESLFNASPVQKRIAGRNIKVIIYLPRSHYNRYHNDQFITNEDVGCPRLGHLVSHHLRRANSPSAVQRFRAQCYGVALSDNFAFVRPQDRGADAHEKQGGIYRS